MKPKLLYLAPQNPFPPIDGGKISIYYPLIYFSKYFQVFFTFPYYKDVDIYKTQKHLENQGIKALPFFHNTKNDLKYLSLNFFKSIPFKWDKYYSKKFQIILDKLIEEENIRIIWVSAPHMAKYAVEARKKFPEIKIYLREHNIEFKLVEQFRDYTNNIIFKTIAEWQLNKSKKKEIEYWKIFDKTFFISDLDYNIAKGIIPEISHKFIVIYDGYELIVSEPIKPQIKGFIYTANLKTIQNHISFKWFVENIWIPNYKIFKDFDFKLYITGNSIETVKKIISIQNLEKYNIINLGFVEDIDREILKYKYVLSPTIIGSGVRLKVLNGMACGKPVFLTPLDLSTCNVFKDMENIVSFSNKEDFLQKLFALEGNEDLYYNISKNAIETIKSYFNWNKYGEKVYKIIMEVFR